MQVPVNLYTKQNYQAFRDVVSKQTKVDVRSIFLQGLLSNNSIKSLRGRIPINLLVHHKKVLEYCNRNRLDLAHLAIQCVQEQNFDSVVVGFDKIEQIDLFNKYWTSKIKTQNKIFFELESQYTDPRKWKKI